MDSTERILCRVILSRVARGESLAVIMASYPLLLGESLQRVLAYVEH